MHEQRNINDVNVGNIYDCYSSLGISCGMLYLIISKISYGNYGNYIAINLKTMKSLELVIYKRDVLVACLKSDLNIKM